MGAAPLLTVTLEGEMIKTFPVQGEVLLGRAEGCAIRLDDRAISRQHAVFRSIGDSIQVEKKSEFAPFFVNGEECTRAVLKEGDVVSIGPYLIKVSTPVASLGAVSPPIPFKRESQQTSSLEKTSSLGASSDLQHEGADLVFSLDGQGEKNGLNFEEKGSKASSSFDLESNVSDGAVPILEVSQQDPPELESLDGHAAGELGQKFELEPPQSYTKETGPVDEDGITKIASPEKVAIMLIFQEGAANFTKYELTQDEVSIGRGKNCNIVLNDKKASRKNAIIRRAGLDFYIKDLSSANGTFVNDIKVDEKQLSGDDRIRIGNVEFQFKAVSTDYKEREKNFLNLPPDSDIPNLDIQNMMSEAPVNPAPEPQNIVVPQNEAGVNPVEAYLRTHPNSPEVQLAGDMGVLNGIVGINSKSGKRKSLSDRFRELPRRSQIIWIIAGICFGYWLMSEDDLVPVAKNNQKKQTSAKATPSGLPVPATFESLSEEKKQFIESRHAAAFDYYKNREFDKALFEIQKIFVIITDYKDAREIERYAKEGKRKQEAIAEEQRKKEDEANLKLQVAQLTEETKKRMDKKDYEAAKELFLQILTLDPDNAAVTAWKKDIEAYEDELRVKEQARQVQNQINKQGWELFKEGTEFKKARKFYSAIETFQKTIDIGTSDRKLLSLSKRMMAACRSLISSLREPVLAAAKTAEEAGEFTKAFELYQKATRIDPHHPGGYAGINRIKGILHDRAKSIYTEAVLAESYSDFNNAKKMFQECLQVSPKDDVYHDRAARKLSHYFKKDEGPAQ